MPVSVRAALMPVALTVVSRSLSRSQPAAPEGDCGPSETRPVRGSVVSASSGEGPGAVWSEATARRVSARPSRARAFIMSMASSVCGLPPAPCIPSDRAMIAVRAWPTESWSSAATRAWWRAASRWATSRCSADCAASWASPCSRASRREREIEATASTRTKVRIPGLNALTCGHLASAVGTRVHSALMLKPMTRSRVEAATSRA